MQSVLAAMVGMTLGWIVATVGCSRPDSSSPPAVSPAVDSGSHAEFIFVFAEGERRPQPGLAEPEWRRTASGWERKEFWGPEPEPPRTLHPALLATFQVLTSIAALLAWPEGTPLSAARSVDIAGES